MMKSFFAWLAEIGLNEVSIIAGGLGAALAAIRLKGTLPARIIKFTVGFACALWGPGIIIKYMTLPSEPQYFGALGFVFGYFGMTIMDAIEDVLASIVRHLKEIDWKAIATGWISRK